MSLEQKEKLLHLKAVQQQKIKIKKFPMQKVS